MADKNSRLNLVQSQQANKEIVINGALNAMSPSAFGGNNVQANNGLIWGIYGGSTGTTLIPNSTITLTDNAVQYLSFNDSTLQFEISLTAFGDYPCYKITTSNGVVKDWLDYRPKNGGGGGGSSDPNFSSNGVPSTTPAATGTKSIAIGESAAATGNESFAAMEGEASGELSVSFGRNNKSFGARSLTIGGVSNRIETTTDSSIIGGNSNYIQGQQEYFCIINSVSCRIRSGTYASSMIINAKSSEISASNAVIMNAYQAYIDAGADYSTIIGRSGYLNTPYTFQMSFGGKIRKDYTGFSELGSGTTNAKLIIGDNQANVKRFVMTEGMVMHFKISLFGVDTSNNNVCKLSTELTVKRFSNIVSFVNESGTSKNLTLDFWEGTLSGVSATVDLENTNEINVNATGIADTSIRWCCMFDTISLNK